MNTRIMLGIVMILMFCVTRCEEEVTPDYALDIMGIYGVQSAIFFEGGDYENFILSSALEHAWLFEISRESFVLYKNDDNYCDTTYSEEIRVITSISDTLVSFEDGAHMYYSLSAGELTINYDSKQFSLSDYTGTFPPAVWRDPSLLTNDVYEPDNSFTEATRISAGGSTQDHYQAVCDDQDYFVFEALEGTIYVLGAVATDNSEMDLTLTLFSSSADTIVFNDDRADNDLDPELEWVCDADDDYYFVIQKYWDYLDPGNSMDDEEGEYTVSVGVTKALSASPAFHVDKKQRPVRSMLPKVE